MCIYIYIYIYAATTRRPGRRQGQQQGRRRQPLFIVIIITMMIIIIIIIIVTIVIISIILIIIIIILTIMIISIYKNKTTLIWSLSSLLLVVIQLLLCKTSIEGTAISVVKTFATKMLGPRLAKADMDFRTLCAGIPQRPPNRFMIVPDSRLEVAGFLMRKRNGRTIGLSIEIHVFCWPAYGQGLTFAGLTMFAKICVVEQ